MTYGQLLEQLSKLTSQQLNQSVTVYREDTYPGDEDEYLPVNHIGVAVGSYGLDAEHIVLNTGGE